MRWSVTAVWAMFEVAKRGMWHRTQLSSALCRRRSAAGTAQGLLSWQSRHLRRYSATFSAGVGWRCGSWQEVQPILPSLARKQRLACICSTWPTAL
jgi:hypothetical protein